VALENATSLSREQASVFQDAARVPAPGLSVVDQDALRGYRLVTTQQFQNAVGTARGGMVGLFQDGLRDRRNYTAGVWQVAVAKSVLYTGSMSQAVKRRAGWESVFQDAMRPPPGVSVIVPPAANPCYIPPAGDAVHLRFLELGTAPHLVFYCDEHPMPPPAAVVVPIRRVYIVLNDVSLKRVEGNVPLPTFTMTLNLDYQSWTWGFTASLPAQALADLEPSSPGEPVEVEASINGAPYRFYIEKRVRSRTFGKASITVNGRGRSALLDAPYAAVQSFTNVGARTSQQLMDDVLTLNGIPLGWTVDWGITAWNVPAGGFSHQGTYISALNAIAGAAGAYLQPHPTDDQINVRAVYPTVPWAWNTVDPDYELPAAVTTQEGIEWIEKPRYNRVYVSGVNSGVLGRVTRQGTAGDILAPTVTDSLITEAVAARQRGIAILGDTGSRRDVTLRLPVLEETGIIVPGKFVRYDDGDTEHFGIVRGVQVDAGMPEVWQQILVETRDVA
jgi:hypothetical protein